MRVNADEFYDEMSREQVVSRLKELNEYDENDGLTKMRKKLKKMERTRHLQIWHDHSTLANHGHILFMVSCLYDPAIHLTNQEYKLKTGEEVDVQSQVEKPEIYIVGRCSSSDTEQLAYIESRLCCLQHLQRNLHTEKDGSVVEITDKMRFFHGDSPAQNFESGQQKGGHYYCSGCGVHASRVFELDHTFRCRLLSLRDRQDLVLMGSIGRNNSIKKKSKPFSKLKKDQLIQELTSRGIFEGDKKKELEDTLVCELHGVQQVPALLFENPTKDLKAINLEDYEILVCEPMHDISNHIANILTELPSHVVNLEHKKLIEETIALTIGGKETKRAFDYRCAIIALSSQLKGVVDTKVQALVDTLVDIQELLYEGDDQRFPRNVLRLHNSTWYHAILCREVLGFKLNELTTRKFYGTYFHDLTAHAPLQLRLVSGKTANAEEEERMFNTVKSITSSTSNGRPDHIIGNLFVRLQAEEHLGKCKSSVKKQESQVYKLAKSLPLRNNTIIPLSVIKKHARSWQAHLERIADFLLPGKGVWWDHSEEGIEFFDSQNAPKERSEGPILHHFRSSNQKMEQTYLQKCWAECLEKLGEKLCIPTHVIWTEDEHGKVTRQNTCFLKEGYTGNHEAEEEIPVTPASTATTSIPTHADLQEEEDEDVILFNLVPEEECILDQIGAEDTQCSKCVDQGMEDDVSISLEPDVISNQDQPQPTSESPKDFQTTGN